MRVFATLCLAVLLAGAVPGEARGQDGDKLRLSTPSGGTLAEWALVRHRGYPAVPSAALAAAGWTLEVGDGTFLATLPGGTTLEFHPAAPFVRLDSTWAQLTVEPYLLGDTLYLPLQLFTDLLPDRLHALYAARSSYDLAVLPDSLRGGGSDVAVPDVAPREPAVLARPDDPKADGVRVVIIDPGHGGVDAGSSGPGRTREKDVALAVGLALAKALEGHPGLEVHLTRDTDELVPLWERGAIATRLRGENRYGVFVSIHANAVTNRDVRGVETYYLSDARTEHEARVAALENSAEVYEQARSNGPGQGDLSVMLSDLLNNDLQHWSSDLAEGIQSRISREHPGPNRGVKQGILAVLTNVMMPAALVEVGFLSNPAEERLLSDPAFHQDMADAMASAVLEFFERYPPGGGQGRSER